MFVSRACIGWQRIPLHLRYLQPRALGRKASDEFTVPLCRVHHRAGGRTLWPRNEVIGHLTRLASVKPITGGTAAQAKTLDYLVGPIVMSFNRAFRQK